MLLSLLPREELDRVSEKVLAQYYRPEAALEKFGSAPSAS